MASLSLTRWLAPVVFAAGLGIGALTPTPAQARDGDDLVRVAVAVADVVLNGGQPYYRYGPHYGPENRLVVVYDHYRRPTYYRYVPRRVYLAGPPYGHAYGYYRNAPVYYRAGGHRDYRPDYRDHRGHDRDRRDGHRKGRGR